MTTKIYTASLTEYGNSITPMGSFLTLEEAKQALLDWFNQDHLDVEFDSGYGTVEGQIEAAAQELLSSTDLNCQIGTARYANIDPYHAEPDFIQISVMELGKSLASIA